MLRAASSILSRRRHELFPREAIPRCWWLHTSALRTDYSSARTPQGLSFDGYRYRRSIWRECNKELNSSRGDSFGKVLYNLKMLGGQLVIEPPAVKVKLAEDILQQIRDKGIKVNVGMYNILLRVYISNDHTFSPSEFLENMEKDNISPNDATIFFLFKAFCNQGNLHKASKLLDHINSMETTIADHEIHANLITGNARADNMEGAEELLETLKSDYQGPLDLSYSSLIQAYAERGNVDAIEKTLDDMRSRRIQPKIWTYFNAISALSKGGHGTLASRILDRLDNIDWITSDLRTLACNCSVRGELEVPRMIIKLLAKIESVDSIVMIQYIVASLEKGMALSEIISDLKEDVNFNQFPRLLYESVIFRLIQGHIPVVVGQSAPRFPPKPGALAPLQDGDTWVKNMLDWYSFMTSEGHSDAIPASYYYPLLARCCSDENMEGFMACWNQLTARGYSLDRPIIHYFERMMSNPNVSLEKVDSMVPIQDIVACVEKGRSLSEIINNLKEDEDFKQFPRLLFENITFRLLQGHSPVVVGQTAPRFPPQPGALAPLQDGDTWVKNMLDWYSFITSEGHSGFISACYYYPLLARCCSDENMDGFVASWKQLKMRGYSLNRPIIHYFDQMLSNPNISLENYVSSSMSKCEVGSEAYADAAVWGFLLYCASGNFEQALKSVGDLKESRFLLDNSVLVSKAVKCASKLPEHNLQLVQLLKALRDLPHPPDLNSIVGYVSSQHIYRNQSIHHIMDFFSSLEKEGIPIKTGFYIHLMTKLSNKDKDNFLRLYDILINDRIDEVEDGGYVIMFSAATRTENYTIGRKLYDFLPAEISSNEDIRCSYLRCLSSWKNTIPRAIDLLNVMLSEGQKPRFINWFRLIPRVLLTDPDLAKEYIEKMKSCGYQPNSTMRHRLLELYVQLGLVEDAKREMADIISNDWASVKSYSHMIKLWSDRGDVEEVKRLLDEMKTDVGEMDARSRGSMLVTALIKSGNYDDALSTLAEMKSTPPPSHTLNLTLVEFSAAGRPLDPVFSVLKEMSLDPALLNSLLFFAHVDSGKEADAISVIKDVNMDQDCFPLRMSHPNASEYLRVLKECDYHQRDKESAALVMSGYRLIRDSKETSHTKQRESINNVIS